VHAFFIDADGDWVNWQREATFVSPVRHIQDARSVERTVRDYYSHRYVPHDGDVVVDVGAGIGEDTVIYSKVVGSSGRVIAIEAQPRTFACLEKTVQRNGFTNVTTVNCAITDSSQEVSITDDTERHLWSTITGSSDTGVRVRGRTLDSVLAELRIDRIDLLKVNIEGAEKSALVGMTEALARTRFATIACHDFIADAGGPESMRTRSAVHAFLEEYGFDIVRRGEDPRPWVRDHLYGANRRPTAAAYAPPPVTGPICG
jgi:FkbM family methyltransferase